MLWRPGVLTLAALVLSACGQSTSASPPQHPQLKPVSQRPLRVAGTGFRAGEKVRLVADKHVENTRADSSGSFKAAFPGLSGCGSTTVTATGSKGSRAEFNLSEIAC